MKLSDVVHEALAYMKPETWTKNHYSSDDQHSFCFVGQLGRSYSSLVGLNTIEYDPLQLFDVTNEWFEDFAGRQGINFHAVVDFNDDMGTSFEDVMLAMKDYAAWAEEHDKEIS